MTDERTRDVCRLSKDGVSETRITRRTDLKRERPEYGSEQSAETCLRWWGLSGDTGRTEWLNREIDEGGKHRGEAERKKKKKKNRSIVHDESCDIQHNEGMNKREIERDILNSTYSCLWNRQNNL